MRSPFFVGALICLIGCLLTPFGIFNPHTHWLFGVGYVSSSLGAFFFSIWLWRYLNVDFLPLFDCIDHICEESGTECDIRPDRVRWALRIMIVSAAAAGTFVTAAELLKDRYTTFHYVGLGFELSFVVVIGWLSARLKSMPRQVDVLIRQFEDGTAPRVSNSPPVSAKFLLLLLPRRYRETLIGDLEEEFTLIVLPQYGVRRARYWYWWQVLVSIAPLLWCEAKRIAGALLLLRSVR